MRNTIKLFGAPVDIVNLEEALERFKYLLERNKFSMIFTPNTEIIMLAKQDRELKNVLIESDMNLPDGIGLVIASKIHKLGLKERVTGVDMMERILNYANLAQKSIYVFGGKPGVAEKAAQNIADKFPNIHIKGYQNGYFDTESEMKIIDRINEQKPDILFVALGAPKQEKWIYKHRNILNTKIAMGVGGSIDIWAGTAKRAPKIFCKLGLEWFYRLLMEPWRIKRMMALPKFLLKVITTRDITKG